MCMVDRPWYQKDHIVRGPSNKGVRRRPQYATCTVRALLAKPQLIVLGPLLLLRCHARTLGRLTVPDCWLTDCWLRSAYPAYPHFLYFGGQSDSTGGHTTCKTRLYGTRSLMPQRALRLVARLRLLAAKVGQVRRWEAQNVRRRRAAPGSAASWGRQHLRTLASWCCAVCKLTVPLPSLVGVPEEQA